MSRFSFIETNPLDIHIETPKFKKTVVTMKEEFKVENDYANKSQAQMSKVYRSKKDQFIDTIQMKLDNKESINGFDQSMLDYFGLYIESNLVQERRNGNKRYK